MKRLALALGLAVASTTAAHAEGADFSGDAALLYRIAACVLGWSLAGRLACAVDRLRK